MAYRPGDVQDLVDFSTLRRRAAIHLNHPITQLVVISPKNSSAGLSGTEFVTLVEYFRRGINKNIPFIDIYKDLKSQSYDPTDIVMSYLEYLIELDSRIDISPLYESNVRLDSNSNELLEFLVHTIRDKKRRKDKATNKFYEVEYDFIGLTNLLLENSNEQKFRDYTDLETRFSRWLQSNVKSVQQYIVVNNQKAESEARLNSIEMSKQSPIFVGNVTVSANPMINNVKVKLDDGLNIFENANLSINVPYIQYNSASTKYYKVWEGDQEDNKPKYDLILKDSEAIHTNHIYLTLWTGIDESPKNTKNSYKLVTYDLEENSLKFDLPSNSEIPNYDNILINRVKDVLGVTFNIGTNKIATEYYIYDVDGFDQAIFLNFVTSDQVLYNYIYYNESQKAYPLNSRFFIHFNPEVHNDIDDINIGTRLNISVQEINNNDKPILKTAGGSTKLTVVPAGTQLTSTSIHNGSKYLFIEMNTPSLDEANRFAAIFNKLVKYVLINQGAIQNFYQQLIPEMYNVIVNKPVKMSKNIKGANRQGPGGSTINALKDIDPEVFTSGYARNSCQNTKGNRRQPSAILPEDYDSIKDKGYQVLKYPRDSRTSEEIADGVEYHPRFYFYCPGETHKYPGVVINRVVNSNFSHLPCCFAAPQITDPGKTTYAYYNGLTEIAKQTTNKTTTNKFARPGNIAELPSILRRIISLYRDNAGNIVRLGTASSPNSAIHGILAAIRDDNYLSRQNDSDREGYVRGVRLRMLQEINIGLMKQELYDWSDEQIYSNFNDVESFFDPKLYYRALEETFNINVYVFVTKRSSSKRGASKSMEPQFEVPRHKLFHTRVYNPNRRTIILYKHWGSESDTKPIPQCELIIEELSNKSSIISESRIEIFNNVMNKYIYSDIYLNSHNIITWSFNGASIVNRFNFYNYFDYKFNNVVGQFVDAYGKSRGVIFDNITMFYPPVQPLNLPVIYEQILSDYETVVGKFGQPTAASKNNELITGLWFKLYDMEQGFYIPITPIMIEGIPDGNSHPMISLATGPALRYKSMNRTVNIIFQIIVWLYQLFDPDRKLADQLITDPNNYSKFQPGVEEFFNKYTSMGTVNQDASSLVNQIDTATIYNFDNMPKNFWPEVVTVDQGIKELASTVTNLVINDKLFLYNNWFRVRLMYRLTRYLIQSKSDDKIIDLKNLYQGVNDFTQRSNTIVIIGQNDYKEWLAQQKRLAIPYQNVRTKLDISSQFDINPYIYHDKTTDRYYLIQNVQEGKKSKALAAALKWQTEGINPGSSVGELVHTSDEKYIVYGISSTNFQFYVKENNTNGETDYLQILEYSRRYNPLQGDETVGEYAAVLPIY